MMLYMRVMIRPYDSGLPGAFERVRAGLEAALDDLVGLRIEHVGSTAVPGLAAKPVLDIDVVVPPGSMTVAIAALTTAGYRDQGEQGIPGRHALGAPQDGVVRHVYVCVEGCLALRNHLAVRAVLRAGPMLRAEYQNVKLTLGDREIADIDEYISGKAAVLQRILQRAGVSDSELAEIARMNPLKRA